jgi:hypothetical protein
VADRVGSKGGGIVTTHIYHQNWDPDFRPDAPVLCDDCERCHEHAFHPYRSLDLKRQKRLRYLFEHNGPWHSTLDRVAAERLFIAEMGR